MAESQLKNCGGALFVGLLLGVGAGAALRSVAIGIAIGVALGLTSAAYSYFASKKDEPPTPSTNT